MSENINTGGPAFPVPGIGPTPNGGATDYSTLGMSLRDYFAIHANIGEPSLTTERAAAIAGVATPEWRNDLHWPIVEAVIRYRYADAMLAQREKQP